MIEDKVERDSSSASDDEEDMDTDEELQEAFAAGLIKPGKPFEQKFGLCFVSKIII